MRIFEIPVIILFTLDPQWSEDEQLEVLKVTSQARYALEKAGNPTTLVPVVNDDIDSIMSDYDPLDYVIFNWCDNIPGLPHSEWLLVKYLEEHGFTFTGASSATLALTQDKCRVKQLLDEAGILTPKWDVYEKGYPIMWRRFPAIVKPSREHSSEGIHRNAVVLYEETLKTRIRYVIKRFQHPALVEDFIDGRELHVSLWGNGKIEMLPPAEMEFSLFENGQERLCTYESKFVPESEQYKQIKTVLPAPLNKSELSDLENVCKSAYYISGCRDYARIDIRMRDGLFYILDVNPNADICPDTSTIAAAEYAGYSYDNFLSGLISMAAQRHPRWGNYYAISSGSPAVFQI